MWGTGGDAHFFKNPTLAFPHHLVGAIGNAREINIERIVKQISFRRWTIENLVLSFLLGPTL
jgi:hypothetical protein